MEFAIYKFVQAQDRYLALTALRERCPAGAVRERLHLAILQAHRDMQQWARVVVGVEKTGDSTFAR